MIHAEITRALTLRSLRRRLRGVAGTSPVVVLCLLLCRCGSSDAAGLFNGDGPAPSQNDAAPLSPAPTTPAQGSAPEAAPSPAAPAAQPESASTPDAAVSPPPASAPPVSAPPSNPSAPSDTPPAGAPMDAPPVPVDPAEDEPASQEAPDPAEPAPVSTITIERARWNEGDQVLEVRGEVSSPDVTLTVRFRDRTEELVNDDGEFRAEFEDVEDEPGTLQIIASDGATLTVPVEEE